MDITLGYEYLNPASTLVVAAIINFGCHKVQLVIESGSYSFSVTYQHITYIGDKHR